MGYIWFVAILIHCCYEVSSKGVRLSYIDAGCSTSRTTNFRRRVGKNEILKGRTRHQLGGRQSSPIGAVQNNTTEEICNIVTQANVEHFTAIQHIREGEDNHKGLLHAQKALDAYLRISNGKDHPGVAVLLRLVATLSQAELSRSEVQSLLDQAQNMWSRMYDGAYRIKLDERFRKTFNFIRSEEHFEEFEGLLTEKDCERVITWAQSRIQAQHKLSENFNKAWEDGKFNVKDYAAYNNALDVGNQDLIDLKFYESVLLTRIFLSAARLTGVPLNRVTDLSVQKFKIGSIATDFNKLDFYVSDKESSHVEYSLTIFLNDDFNEGQMFFPYLENDGRDYLVKPKTGKAVWIREKDQSRFDVLKSTTHRHFAPSSGIRDKWIIRIGIGSENYAANWIDFESRDVDHLHPCVHATRSVVW
mmetsp:Transcript_17147/g.23998  ORF Transcript_17147/g.23998 Transcript_17147/m.23998 type:complete len:417 (+) Transcript_17147:201-1451(+)